MPAMIEKGPEVSGKRRGRGRRRGRAGAGAGRCAAAAALLHPPPRSPRTLRLIPALRWDSVQPALLPATGPASPRSRPFPLAKPTFWEARPPAHWTAFSVHRGGPALPFAGLGGGVSPGRTCEGSAISPPSDTSPQRAAPEQGGERRVRTPPPERRSPARPVEGAAAWSAAPL